MPFNGAGAEKQLSADFGVGASVTGEPGDLQLLGGEINECLHRAFAYGLAGGEQFDPGSLGERLNAHGAEHFVGGAELLTGVDPPVLAPQPLAVEEMGAGDLLSDRCAAQPLDRFAVVVFGRSTTPAQRLTSGLDSERPVGAAGTCGL